MVEMEPIRAKFKILGQHRIPELTGANFRQEFNLGPNINMYKSIHFHHPNNNVYVA